MRMPISTAGLNVQLTSRNSFRIVIFTCFVSPRKGLNRIGQGQMCIQVVNVASCFVQYSVRSPSIFGLNHANVLFYFMS